MSKPAYIKALAGYLKANGISTVNTASVEVLSGARAYAIVEAQKAAYRDNNDFSDFVAKLGRGYRGSNKIAKPGIR